MPTVCDIYLTPQEWSSVTHPILQKKLCNSKQYEGWKTSQALHVIVCNGYVFNRSEKSFNYFFEDVSSLLND